MKNVRLQYVDVAKGIGILLVVIGHMFPVHSIVASIYSFHMPLFFILSGFFLNSESSVKSMFVRGCKMLIIPYAFTATMTFLLSLIIDRENSLNTFWGIFLVDCKIGTFAVNSIGAIWFLICLFISRIIALVALKKTNGVLVVFTLAVILLFYSNYHKDIKLPLCVLEAIVTSIFVLVGFYIRKSNLLDKNFDVKLLFVVTIFFFSFARYVPIASRINLYPLGTINILISSCLSYLLIVLCKNLENNGIAKKININRYLSYCGRYSLIILCFHSIEVHFQLLSRLIPSIYATILFNIIILSCIPLIIQKVYFLRWIFISKTFKFKE